MPYLTIFAGPNGSGKSTIKQGIEKLLPKLGHYVNSDEIEASIRINNELSFDEFGISTSQTAFFDFYNQSTWKNNQLSTLSQQLEHQQVQIIENIFVIESEWVNGYTAAILADFIREELLKMRADFSFETVMSHPSKIEVLQRAKSLGYTINLIFVSTKHPDINVKRVSYRVKQGGHSVPEQKIRERYYRCMELLYDAFLLTDNAYIYDNSDGIITSYNDKLVARKEDKRITLGKYTFDWFEKYLINKLPKRNK